MGGGEILTYTGQIVSRSHTSSLSFTFTFSDRGVVFKWLLTRSSKVFRGAYKM